MSSNAQGSAATASLTAQPSQPVVWSAATDEIADAQLSTFVYGSIVKARDRVINPAVASWLDTQFRFYVNESGVVQRVRDRGRRALLPRDRDVPEHRARRRHRVPRVRPRVPLPLVPARRARSTARCPRGSPTSTRRTSPRIPRIGRGFYYTDEPVRDIDPDRPRVDVYRRTSSPSIRTRPGSSSAARCGTCAARSSATSGTPPGVAQTENDLRGHPAARGRHPVDVHGRAGRRRRRRRPRQRHAALLRDRARVRPPRPRAGLPGHDGRAARRRRHGDLGRGDAAGLARLPAARRSRRSA